ncbi:MAG: tetratricopeptide repeat protein [Planctomycetes bacterium]|nr:tetratricopeptide repeat protein [Planctomycetota bacterium]
MKRVIVALCLLSIGSAALAFERGQSVVALRRSEVKIEKEVVDVVPAGAQLRIESVEGQWLLVNNGKSGWVKRDHVLPASEALDYFNRQLRVQPQNAELLFARGNVYRSLGEFEAAIDDYDAAIRLHPQAAAYNGRARAHFEAGHMDKAIADFSTAIRLMPNSALLYNNRAAAWEKQGDITRALADLEQARRLDPEHEFVLNNHARLQTAGE